MFDASLTIDGYLRHYAWAASFGGAVTM